MRRPDLRAPPEQRSLLAYEDAVGGRYKACLVDAYRSLLTRYRDTGLAMRPGLGLSPQHPSRYGPA